MSKLEDRFWAKVNKTGECWEWTACVGNHGYGLFRYGSTINGTRRMSLVHRLSWELVNGRIPTNMLVCHTCDNKICVNPNHLWIGDHAANQKDKCDKGRQKRGESHYKTTLKPEDVINIRSLAGIRKQKAIARDYGISRESVSRIQVGTNWKHI